MTAIRIRLGAAAVALVLVAATAACTADTPDTTDDGWGSVPGLPDEAIETMNGPSYADARWSIAVSDIDTGEVLVDLDGDKMVEPASFVKSYSVGAAWLNWGPDHQIVTPVKRTGELVGATLQGDLVLVGKGDITLGGRTKPDGTVDYTNLDHNDANPLPGATLTTEDPLAGIEDLAHQVKTAGIDTVSGDVIVDDRLFQGELAGEPITPIVINQNLIDVLVTPGEAGEPATVEMSPAVAPWRIVGQVDTVAAGGDTSIDDPESSIPGELFVGGTIAADSEPVLKVYELDDPATYARTAFIEALGRAGVTVSADPVSTNSTAMLADPDAVDALPSVAEFESLPLAEQATYIMKISYNRGAQTYICLLAAEAGEDDCSTGLSEVGRIWAEAGLDTEGVSLIDGSGLNGNFVTPENAVALQVVMADRPDAERWKATMPILGVDGSLADVQSDSPAAGHVFAKTGTLVGGDDVNGRFRLNTKALGGVMETESGRNLAFIVIMNQGFTSDIDGVFQANDDVGKVVASIQQHY
jgi:D-alanyl-D-alanine carboxypeptidase/D-alanyl-D-alanine-endopeptidase (penicillin-binding protein 4)